MVLLYNGGWMMMRRIGELLTVFLLVACSATDVETSQENRVNLNMATVGAGNFGDYIRSLSIYAFRLTASGDYVYSRTLADLDAAGIAALTDVPGQGNAKLYNTSLAVGTYELYFVGNGTGNIEGNFQEGITRPEDILLKGNPSGLDNIYFLGKRNIRVVTDLASPVSVTLNRVVSKLVVILDGVPEQIVSIRLAVGNIATAYRLSGETASGSTTIEKTFKHAGATTNRPDTVVYELLMLPAVGIDSPFHITFQAENGQEKTKEMPPLKLLPNKYVRVTATISDAPGSLVSFEVAVNVLIFDFWSDEILPDFPIKPNN